MPFANYNCNNSYNNIEWKGYLWKIWVQFLLFNCLIALVQCIAPSIAPPQKRGKIYSSLPKIIKLYVFHFIFLI